LFCGGCIDNSGLYSYRIGNYKLFSFFFEQEFGYKTKQANTQQDQSVLVSCGGKGTRPLVANKKLAVRDCALQTAFRQEVTVPHKDALGRRMVVNASRIRSGYELRDDQ
jgi:hypothetical protein